MVNFKSIVVLTFIMLGLHQSYSQTYNFKTYGLSVLEKDAKGKWGSWTDLDLVTILVKLDTNKNRFIIYSEAIQVFEIVDYIPLVQKETDDIYSFAAIDNLGENCTLSIIIRKKQNNRKQLYIHYDNRVIVYNMTNFE